MLQMGTVRCGRRTHLSSILFPPRRGPEPRLEQADPRAHARRARTIRQMDVVVAHSGTGPRWRNSATGCPSRGASPAVQTRTHDRRGTRHGTGTEPGRRQGIAVAPGRGLVCRLEQQSREPPPALGRNPQTRVADRQRRTEGPGHAVTGLRPPAGFHIPVNSDAKPGSERADGRCRSSFEPTRFGWRCPTAIPARLFVGWGLLGVIGARREGARARG